MPSQLNSKKIKDDLEFERLLYLASALQSYQRSQPAKIDGVRATSRTQACASGITTALRHREAKSVDRR